MRDPERTLGVTLYALPADPVTARIVSEFEDWEGWSDSDTPKPISRRLARALDQADPFDVPESRIPVPDPVEVPTGPRCPTCGCSLPEPNHLVSNARLAGY